MSLSSNATNSLIAGLTVVGILVLYSGYQNYQVYKDTKKNEEEIEKERTKPMQGGRKTRRKKSK
jgi:hypothetical protein